MRARRLVPVIMLVGALSLGLQAHAGRPEVDGLMQQSFQQFDQSMDSGWNVLMLEMKYPEAVEAILDYGKTNAVRLQAWQKGSLAFHLGRLYALEDRREQAVATFRQVLASGELGNPAYVEAFIAFLDGDRVGLLKERGIITGDKPSPWQKADLADVDEMVKYFGKPYEAAYGALSCVDNTTPVSGTLWPAYCQAVLKKYAAVYQGR